MEQHLESAGGDEKVSCSEVGQVTLQVIEDAIPQAAVRRDRQTQPEIESLCQRCHQSDLHACMDHALLNPPLYLPLYLSLVVCLFVIYLLIDYLLFIYLFIYLSIYLSYIQILILYAFFFQFYT